MEKFKNLGVSLAASFKLELTLPPTQGEGEEGKAETFFDRTVVAMQNVSARATQVMDDFKESATSGVTQAKRTVEQVIDPIQNSEKHEQLFKNFISNIREKYGSVIGTRVQAEFCDDYLSTGLFGSKKCLTAEDIKEGFRLAEEFKGEQREEMDRWLNSRGRAMIREELDRQIEEFLLAEGFGEQLQPNESERAKWANKAELILLSSDKWLNPKLGNGQFRNEFQEAIEVAVTQSLNSYCSIVRCGKEKFNDFGFRPEDLDQHEWEALVGFILPIAENEGVPVVTGESTKILKKARELFQTELFRQQMGSYEKQIASIFNPQLGLAMEIFGEAKALNEGDKFALIENWMVAEHLLDHQSIISKTEANTLSSYEKHMLLRYLARAGGLEGSLEDRMRQIGNLAPTVLKAFIDVRNKLLDAIKAQQQEAFDLSMAVNDLMYLDEIDSQFHKIYHPGEQDCAHFKTIASREHLEEHLPSMH